ncbi:MAG: hypothetical protein Q6358_14835 [Candidatus Brocadiales bacterium]|nr:hypothetical protein [Candidatus Brocadiales bacterium]
MGLSLIEELPKIVAEGNKEVERIGENTFYSMITKGTSIEEILEYSKLTK